MKITELADILGQDIEVIRHHGQDGRWTAKLKNAEIKGDSVRIGGYGTGNSCYAAISDYCDRIKGEILVLNAYTDKRSEHKVPNTLEY